MNALAPLPNLAPLHRANFAAVSDITNGLLGWWKFNEGAGTGAADSSGNGNDAIIANTGTNFGWTSGRNGTGAIDLSVATATRGLYLPSTPTASTTHTIVGWIYPKAGGPTYQTLLASLSAGMWYRGDQNKLTYYLGSDHLSGSVITLSAWSQFACARNGTSATFYLNGVADGTIGLSSASSGTMGYIGNDTSSERFNGYMDDLRIYDRTLSAGEIATLYANGAK